MARILVILTGAVAVGLALMVLWRAPRYTDPLQGISDAELRSAAAAQAAQRAASPSRLLRETSTTPNPDVPAVMLPPTPGPVASIAPPPDVDESHQRQQTRERAVEAARQRPPPAMAERAPREPWLPPAERAAPRATLVEPVDEDRAAAWRLRRSGGKSPHPALAIPEWRRP